MIGRLVLAAAALVLAPAASAQNADKPIAEAAADLAYGYCPLYLAGQFPLTGNAQLADLGFGEKIEKAPNPRFGEMQIVTASRGGSELAFGGVPEQICTVVVMGAQRDAALAALRKSMSFMGLDFKPVTDAKVAAPSGVTVETFKAPVDGQFLYVQLIHAGGSTPMVTAQLFGMKE